VCLGLSGAGKSTLLAQLAGESAAGLTPTMGFSIKPVSTPSTLFHIKELGGSEKIRPYWNMYYSDVDGMVHVKTVADVALSVQWLFPSCLDICC